MAAEAPLSNSKLLIDKELLKDVKVLAAIDRGCSLTKVLYTSKSSPDPKKHELNFALFQNNRFEEGLRWLKQEGQFPESGGQLHVTGAGCDKYMDVIKDVVGLDPVFVDEFVSQNRGAHFMIKNLDENLITFKDEAAMGMDVNTIVIPEHYKKLLEAMHAELTANVISGSNFPTLLGFMGSGAGILQINEDSSAKMIGGSMLAGKFFLGLGRLLLGTGDYDEIMALAEKGNRANIDTTAIEIIKDQPNSPYGQMPPDTPLFSMGKAIDLNKGMDSFKREDVARSLVGIVAAAYAPLLLDAGFKVGLDVVYLGGNFVRHPIVRSEIKAVVDLFGNGMMKVKYLNTGHTGAIGAMITNTEDVEKLLAV